MTAKGKPAATLDQVIHPITRLSICGLLASGGSWPGRRSRHPAGYLLGQFAAEIAPDRVLVMNGEALTAPDTHLLRVFAAELLLARRRAQLEAVTKPYATGGPPLASR